jgi:hypothetical protein
LLRAARPIEALPESVRGHAARRLAASLATSPAGGPLERWLAPRRPADAAIVSSERNAMRAATNAGAVGASHASGAAGAFQLGACLAGLGISAAAVAWLVSPSPTGLDEPARAADVGHRLDEPARATDAPAPAEPLAPEASVQHERAPGTSRAPEGAETLDRPAPARPPLVATPPSGGSAAPAPADHVGADALLAETGSLREIRALPGGPRAKLEALQRHARRFPAGVLGAERRLLEVQAWLALGRRDRAERVARELRARDPDGFYAQGVERLLSVPGSPER